MFGMLSGSRSHHTWRQVYAGMCRHQHQRFGVKSVLFLSYEAIFLYLLGVDAGVLPPPADESPRCCKLRKRFPEGPWLDENAATFCAAFGLILARIKLDDDVRDDNSLTARSLLALYKKPFTAAEAWFDDAAPNLRNTLTALLSEHLAMERSEKAPAMPCYVGPTAEAFGSVYASFAKLFGADETSFHTIGADVGAYIIAYDCAVDWRRDRARGQYNPLPDRLAVAEACVYTQDRLSHALWRCQNHLTGHHGITVLQHVFQRVSVQLATFQESMTEIVPARKAGDCDCDCLSCCCDTNACGGSGCKLCDGWCIDCGFCCGDCRKKKDQGKKNKQGNPPSPLIGLEGSTRTALDPSGVVHVAGRDYPAIAKSENLPPHMTVIITAQTEAGLVVIQKPSGPPPRPSV